MTHKDLQNGPFKNQFQMYSEFFFFLRKITLSYKDHRLLSLYEFCICIALLINCYLTNLHDIYLRKTTNTYLASFIIHVIFAYVQYYDTSNHRSILFTLGRRSSPRRTPTWPAWPPPTCSSYSSASLSR